MKEALHNVEQNRRWRAWYEDERLDPGLRAELEALQQAAAWGELEERFAHDLSFGTGGLRAKIGVGSSRMNVHTVRRATQGVVEWIKQSGGSSLVIAYDGRRLSREFAWETALVAAAAGVVAHVFAEAEPTPLLSFAVRHLGCAAGVMITASHNPPEYNGYKVYSADGGQLLPDDARQVMMRMADGDLFAIRRLERDDALARGLVRAASREVKEAYFSELDALYRMYGDAPPSAQKIVYTPLHGTGGSLVPRALSEAGFADVRQVARQAVLDAEFTHASSPNPEEPSAYDRAVQLAQSEGADLILATDPDADRLGVMCRKKDGGYRFFSGNEIGGLLIDGWLRRLQKHGKLPENAVVVTTNVTSDFGEAVAAGYGVRTERVLTGFKFIGAKIKEYEQSGAFSFVFGYEESVGYLALPFVRDKDGVQAAVLVAHTAAEQLARGRTLDEALEELFARAGYFRDRLLGYTFAGQSGVARMERLMADLRARPLSARGLSASSVEDCLAGVRRNLVTGREETLALPASDVLKFRFGDGGWVAVRPSGTEPKLKVYIGVRADSASVAQERLTVLESAIEERVRVYLS